MPGDTIKPSPCSRVHNKMLQYKTTAVSGELVFRGASLKQTWVLKIQNDIHHHHHYCKFVRKRINSYQAVPGTWYQVSIKDDIVIAVVR